MSTPSKIKSRFEQLLSEIYAKRSRQNNQKVCIDWPKPALNFMSSIIKIVHLKYCPVCNL